MAGATTQAERQAQVLAAGYNGPLTDAAVNQAYANAATPSDLASSGISNTPGGSPGAPPNNPAPTPFPGASSADLAKIQAGFAASAGLSIKQLDEQARQFDANLAWQKQMWTNQGLPQLAIQQRAQDLAEKQFTAQNDLANRQQAFTETQGNRQAALAEKTQADANAIAQGQLGVSQGQLGLGQSQLGLDALKTAASLTGPQDWIKAANYARGVAQTNLPAFMTKLLSGDSTAVMGGPAAGASMSAPVTMASLAANAGAGAPITLAPAGTVPAAAAAAAPAATTAPAGAQNADEAWAQLDPASRATYAQYNGGEAGGKAKYWQDAQAAVAAYKPPAAAPVAAAPAAAPASAQITASGVAPVYSSGVPGTAGTGAPSSNVDAAVQGLRAIYAAGGQALGPQQIEGLTPTELQMFQGGGSDVGADVPGYMAAYQRSRIGQQAATPGMSM